MSTTRKHRERAFHDELFAAHEDSRRATLKYYSLRGNTHSFYRNLVSFDCKGKRLLEYGCGTGSDSAFWARAGAIVTGIDISTEGIRKAREHAIEEGVDVDYHVMDAEDLRFDDASFDIVVGGGILHHLNLSVSYSELSRVLSRGGHAVFVEPMGHNPLINVYRKFTPSMRTIDEHPLMMKDIQLARHYFQNVDAGFFNLFTLLAVPFRNTRRGFDCLVSLLTLLDQITFSTLPFTKKYAWMIVLHLSKPRKNVDESSQRTR